MSTGLSFAVEGCSDDSGCAAKFHSKSYDLSIPADMDFEVKAVVNSTDSAHQKVKLFFEDLPAETAGQILRDLGLSKLKLITNHPRPWPTLHGFGLEVVESVPIR